MKRRKFTVPDVDDWDSWERKTQAWIDHLRLLAYKEEQKFQEEQRKRKQEKPDWLAPGPTARGYGDNYYCHDQWGGS